tara:strand:+ start:42 stop:173 length:132 start_codon:yes stop_codon:yes gene_type:complete
VLVELFQMTAVVQMEEIQFYQVQEFQLLLAAAEAAAVVNGELD